MADALHADRQQQHDESASESAADVSTYATSEYDRDACFADAFEPEEFRGMLFHDGVDSQGRPVIVVNTDAVGTTRKARAQALQYMLHRLEPIVVQVLLHCLKDVLADCIHIYRILLYFFPSLFPLTQNCQAFMRCCV